MALTPAQQLKAALALFLAAAAGLTGGVVITKPSPPVGALQCVMAVGNFESTQFSNDSLFLIDTTGAIRSAKGLATVSTTAPVPPAYVNRNVRVCYLNTAFVYTPSPTNGLKCVPAVSAFYANERTSGGPGALDTVLFVPPKGPLRDSIIRADSLPDGSILQDQADSVIARVIQICVDSLTPTAAKWGL